MKQIHLGKLIGSGAGSDVYECGPGRVCKLYKPNAGNVDYEYNKMKEAYEIGLPVPRPYELVEINNRRGFVMEYIEGASFMETMMSCLKACFENGMTNQEIFNSEIIQSQIKTVAFTLADFHSQSCRLQETVKVSLSNSCKYNLYLSAQEKNKVQEFISKLPDGDSLCHGDPNPGNFIKQGGRIRVVDWNDSAKGNFMYDIAQYVLTMRYADVSLDWPGDALGFITEYQNEFSRVFIEEYTKITGKDLSNLKEWTIPVLVSKMGGNNPKKKQERILRDVFHGLRG